MAAVSSRHRSAAETFMLEGEEMSFNRESGWREWLVSEPVSLCGALAAPRAFYWNTGWVE